MTSFAAQVLGIGDRGRLEPGYRADIIIFDPQDVRATATYPDPLQLADGFDVIIVTARSRVRRVCSMHHCTAGCSSPNDVACHSTDGRAIVLDLGKGASLYGQPVAGLGVDELTVLIDRSMADAGTGFAFGRWAEPRELYTTEGLRTIQGAPHDPSRHRRLLCSRDARPRAARRCRRVRSQ